MNTTIPADEMIEDNNAKPGARLRALRLKQGYSSDYIAGKLHLRVRLIELLEDDEYHLMPEPVFVKGYIRAYAKLLDVVPDELLAQFNGLYAPERKIEKALWQSKRETHRAEYAIRWLTGCFALVVLAAVLVWWYSNKDNERLFSSNVSHTESASSKSESEIRLTDLSKMRSLLSSQGDTKLSESASE